MNRAKDSTRRDWPLVGRGDEIAALRRMFCEDAAAGVVLAGPSGVGKTRLATEFLRYTEIHGATAVRALGSRSATALPFGAVAPLLPEAHSGEHELLMSFSAALAERARGRRLVMLVDDAHLLDDGSATLIYQVASANVAFVVVTVRSNEPAPDAVVSLWKEGVVERLELAGLGADAIEGVLVSALGGLVDPAAAAALAEQCQGNVLFLRELVMGALSDGSLADGGGIWRLKRPVEPSQRLIELIEARLVGLAPQERALLEHISFGEPLGSADLTALGGPPELVDRLERLRLLTSHKNGRRIEVRLAHPLYGDVLRARTPAIRVAEIARRLADVIEASSAHSREDILRVATWRLESGGGSADLMLAAAHKARWSYDFALAERLARAALEAGAGLAAGLVAAQVVGLQGRGREAEEEYAALAERARDDSERGLIAMQRVDNWAFYLGHTDEALRIAEEAEATISEALWRDELTAKRATLVLGADGPTAALRLAEPLLDRATDRALVWACAVVAYAADRGGQLDRAIAAADRGFLASQSLRTPADWHPWLHLVHRAEALTHAGRLDVADALVAEQYGLAIQQRSPEAQAFFAWQMATVALERGAVATAASRAREARALFRQLGRPQFEQFCLVVLASAAAMSAAAREAAKALAAMDELSVAPSLYRRVDTMRADAWVAVAQGDIARAMRLLEEAAELGSEIGDRVGEIAVVHDMARLGEAGRVVDRLASLASIVDGPLARARALSARALADSDADALRTVSQTFEELGVLLLSAESASEAAIAFRRNGRDRDCAAAEYRSVLLAERCEGAVTPALLRTAERGRLTPAERDAARRAAVGKSNKQIAQELSLSVRTVENRLLQVYRKLGVSGRGDLGEALQKELGMSGSPVTGAIT